MWGLVGVALFSAFHGLAHGTGMPASAPALVYLVGLLLVSLLIQILGAIAVRESRRLSWPLVRLAGGLLAGGSIGAALM